MAVVGAVAGTKLYVYSTAATSGVFTPPASPDQWLEIGQIANLGNVMQQFSKIAVESVGSGYTYQIKGTQSTPEFALVVNRKDDDVGQVKLKAIVTDRNSLWWFRVVDNDIVASNGTTTYFQGRVYSGGSTYGGVNDLKKTNYAIEIEPDSISVVAAA
jgi:hypothetical protein